MLGDKNAITVLATKNLETAKDFYSNTLGLNLVSETPEVGVLMYKSGNTNIQVYKSDYAGTNQATAVTWEVDNVEAVVADLVSKGVTFEHYDYPGATLQGDVHIMGDMKTSWFKDPDGNTLCVSNTH